MQWIESEFATLKLGHAQRHKRVKTIIEQFSSAAESQPDACKDEAALKTLYRVAKNPKIPASAILNAHHQASIERTA